MKTLTGNCESSKAISLSKATKILSKFVSADNGASEALNAFLIKASEAFNELNQLHKELKPSQSHRKNRRSDSNDVKSVDVKSENGSRKERFRDEKLTQNDVKISQEINGSVVGGSEKLNRKDKKKKLEFGDREDDEKLDKKEQNGIELGHGDEEETKEGRKEKRGEKTKKKNKEIKDEKLEGENAKGQGQEKEIETQISKVENGGIDVTRDLEIRSKKRHEAGSEKEKRKKREKKLKFENEKRQEQLKEIEKKLSNGVKSENGELDDVRDIEIRSKKKYETENENKSNVEEVKTEQKKKKRKHGDGDAEERSGELSKKKMKRKHEGDA